MVKEDYYFENGLMVFTEAYHLKRGYCCESGCRHCPYGFRKERVKPSAMPKIQAAFEKAYQDFHGTFRRAKDPISLVHAYPEKRDREIAGFFAALLAYGNVTTILKSGSTVLSHLGQTPCETLKNAEAFEFPSTFRHRFTTGDDLNLLGAWLGAAIRSHGNLENFFAEGINSQSGMHETLGSFIRRFTAQKLPKKFEPLRTTRARQIKYLLSDPERGSACKRLNMYLRWVVRPDDGIDLGLWTKIKPNQLILPIDTHILQTLQKLRWTKSKTANWKVAEAATKRLLKLSPEDPVRYDFALCHLSMSGGSIKNLIKELPNDTKLA